MQDLTSFSSNSSQYEPNKSASSALFCNRLVSLDDAISRTCADFLVRWDSGGLQVRHVDADSEPFFQYTTKDFISDQLQTIQLITHFNVEEINYLVILTEAASTKTQSLWLVDPYSNIVTLLPFGFNNTKIISIDVTKISAGKNLTHYVVLAGESQFFISGLTFKAESGFIVPTFTETYEVSHANENSTISSVHAYSWSDWQEPILFIGSDQGTVDVYTLMETGEVSLLCQVETESPNPVNYISFDSMEGSTREYGVIFIGQYNELNNEQIMIYQIDDKFEVFSKLVEETSQIMGNGIVSRIKFIRGKKLFNVIDGDYHRVFFLALTSGTTHACIFHTGLKYSTILPQNGLLLDIEPFGNTDSCYVVTSSFVASFYDSNEETKEISVPVPIFKKWFQPLNFAYSTQNRSKILAQRERLNNELLIDKLMLLFGLEGSVVYPPRNFEKLDDLFQFILQSESFDMLRKNCIVYYLLKDIDGNGNDLAAKYAKETELNESYVLAIDGFWEFDHGDVENAMIKLSDPSVDVDWYEKIVHHLCDFGLHELAFKFTKSSKTGKSGDWNAAKIAAKYRVLLKISFEEAFSYHTEFGDRLGPNTFIDILDECFSTTLLNPNPKKLYVSQLLSTSLNPAEEDLLGIYCCSSKNVFCNDFYLVYLIQRCRYAECLTVYDEFRRNGKFADESVSLNLERVEIIKGLKSILPPIQIVSLGIAKSTILLNDEKPLGSLSQSNLIRGAKDASQKALLVAMMQHRMVDENQSLGVLTNETYQHISETSHVSSLAAGAHAISDDMDIDQADIENAVIGISVPLYPELLSQSSTPLAKAASHFSHTMESRAKSFKSSPLSPFQRPPITPRKFFEPESVSNVPIIASPEVPLELTMDPRLSLSNMAQSTAIKSSLSATPATRYASPTLIIHESQTKKDGHTPEQLGEMPRLYNRSPFAVQNEKEQKKASNPRVKLTGYPKSPLIRQEIHQSSAGITPMRVSSRLRERAASLAPSEEPHDNPKKITGLLRSVSKISRLDSEMDSVSVGSDRFLLRKTPARKAQLEATLPKPVLTHRNPLKMTGPPKSVWRQNGSKTRSGANSLSPEDNKRVTRAMRK